MPKPQKPRTQRDVTRALALANSALSKLDGATIVTPGNAGGPSVADDIKGLVRILERIDARETRLDPTQRKGYRPTKRPGKPKAA
jgi:hypothetical protein